MPEEDKPLLESPLSNKEAALISETRWRQCTCREKLPAGTASPLLSKFVLIKIQAAVIGHINFSNRFSLISRLGCPEASEPALIWTLGRADSVGKSGKK